MSVYRIDRHLSFHGVQYIEQLNDMYNNNDKS